MFLKSLKLASVQKSLVYYLLQYIIVFMYRQQKTQIKKDLEKKIVLLMGPRQAGKTWLAKEIAKDYTKPLYLNYDNIKDRKIIDEMSWLDDADLLILDELHKKTNWKSYLKGVYDTKPENMQILVTGSARLSVFEQMGDSLAGRYYRHRLLPFTIGELNSLKCYKDLTYYIQRSGFPEPYLCDNDLEASRWRELYTNSIISTDVFEFEIIKNIKALRTVFELLRTKVGSTISYESIARDANISPTTVKKYIEILEAVYVIFIIRPYSKNIARSLLKEPKIYFFDTGLVNGDEGAKVENVVANCLLRKVYHEGDVLASKSKLCYIRTKDKKEVDFALINDNTINEIIEVKLSDSDISRNLKYFCEKLQVKSTQVVANLKREYQKNNIKVLKLENYLKDIVLS